MNARQKAKKYKRLYNSIRKYTMPVNFNTVNFHTVAVKRSIPGDVALPCIEDGNYIRETISRDMAKVIEPYIIINTQYNPGSGTYEFDAKLTIVDH